VDSIRIANKTTIELGAFYNHRHVDHPIYQYLDYTVDDYGGFVRAVDDRSIGGIRNPLVIGANVQNGTIDTHQYVNVAPASKGALTVSMVDKPKNLPVYAEDSLYVRPDLALIGGAQFFRASRLRRNRFLPDDDQSEDKTFDL
jgi:iron complex outermembrane recepter protein